MTLYNFLQVIDESEEVTIFDRELKQVYSGMARKIANADLLSREVWLVYANLSGGIVIEIRKQKE